MSRKNKMTAEEFVEEMNELTTGEDKAGST